MTHSCYCDTSDVGVSACYCGAGANDIVMEEEDEDEDQNDQEVTEETEETERDGVSQNHQINLLNSMKHSFIKPLHLLSDLSGFPNLMILYSIFCSLSVSSSSAERALSKLKIVKDRLRNSLCDDMLSSLLLIASEKDLMHAINNEDIINRITYATPSLKASLQYRWLNVDLERNWSDETIHNDYFYIWIIYSFETLNEYYNLTKIQM